MSSPSDRKLFLNLSNRIEILAAELGRVLKAEVSDPMKPQQVMVHSAVTARWLAMELAEHNGISMGVEYTFPRIVIDEMLEKVVPEVTASPHFTSESMTWWIFQHVPDYLTKPEFAEVSEYLKSGDDVRRYQLAGKAAWLLHQYQLYRPDMLRDWESANTGDHWQQTLWREMRRQYKGEHSFIDQLQMVHQLSEEAIRDAGLPERLSIFGLNTLTPAYLKILWKISTTTQIDLYLLAPTDQYWGDLTTRKKSTRFLNEEDLSQGNPLLGSWGTLSRDLINQLVDLDFQQRFEYFETPSSATMISCIQRDLQNLEDRTGTEIREKVPDGDVSILVNICHSPMREIETLYDHLLALFEDDENLRPRDILIMAPNIDIYAPYIDAVFGSPESEELRIPYALADQQPRSEFAVIDAFQRVLELGLSRFEVESVMGTLECESIRRRFSLTELDLDRIRKWILDCGIVWALDAEHRQSLGFIPGGDFTWEKGRATLIEGYAMNGEGPRLFNQIFPYQDMEGDHTETLGRFLEAFGFFREVAGKLSHERTLPDWIEMLQVLASRLFAENAAFALELATIQNTLNSLRDEASEGLNNPVSADVLLVCLNERLESASTSGGFLDGRVTFCSMKPMRTIPAPVICLLGMKDSDFPRMPAHQAFDLMAAKPFPGDRSRREDDRQLFLEILLSVRRQLYVSYTGLSARDLSEAPPSVVVSELLDYLKRGFDLPASVKTRLDHKHRLQAFSQEYFLPGSRQSFSRENGNASRNLIRPKVSNPTFFPAPLPEPEEDFQTLSISQLEQFFVNPVKALCETRLGIRLEDTSEILPAYEPIELGALERYKLQQTLAEMALQGNPDLRDAVWEAAEARGQLPAGPFGQVTKAVVNSTVQSFVNAVSDKLNIDAVETVSTDKTFDSFASSVSGGKVGPFHIRGEIEGIYAGTLGRFRCASLKSEDLIRAWVSHVFLNLQRQESTTLILDRDGQEASFSVPEDPGQIAKDLLALYWQGMQKPLPLFPKSSLEFSAYATRFKKSRDNSDPIHKARAKWKSDSFSQFPGEGENAFFRLVFGEDDPFDDEFKNVSLMLFEPLLAHLELKEGTTLP